MLTRRNFFRSSMATLLALSLPGIKMTRRPLRGYTGAEILESIRNYGVYMPYVPLHVTNGLTAELRAKGYALPSRAEQDANLDTNLLLLDMV